MSLRPRYSLLTLLILTALVAGGVKLWFVPQHVVERRNPDHEREYTYTRAWNGDRLFTGAYVERFFEAGSSRISSVSIHFFSRGKVLPWCYRMHANRSTILHDLAWTLQQSQLTETEQAEILTVVEIERQRIQKQGDSVVEAYFPESWGFTP